MRASAGRQRPSYSRQRLQWSRGAKILCLVAALLLFVSQVSPARHQLQKRRQLGEDTALSAALDGLPVSPSAGSGMAGVNVYGLDNSLLAALQNNTNSSILTSNSNSSHSPTAAPSQHAKTAPVSSIGPAMAPQALANPPRSNVTPLDPLLAAALENQGRVSAPAVAYRAPYGSSAPAVAPASNPTTLKPPIPVPPQQASPPHPFRLLWWPCGKSRASEACQCPSQLQKEVFMAAKCPLWLQMENFVTL